MKRVLNAEYWPDLTISNAGELPFRPLAMGVPWDHSPKLSSRLIPCWIPATIPANSASVRLCSPDRLDIRLGP
eukprot:11566298-Prorocentrum_lima.AAC.1